MAKKQSSAKSKKSAARVPASRATVHEFPRRTKGPVEEPKNPLPEQHQPHPGIEAKIEPRPRYWAPHYRGSGKLMDKVALITGGDSGIGRSVAVLYAREGADVAIVYLPQEQVDAEETRDAVENEGRNALLIPGDVSKSDFCRNAVEQTLDEFGQ